MGDSILTSTPEGGKWSAARSDRPTLEKRAIHIFRQVTGWAQDLLFKWQQRENSLSCR
jgi:hypothetical protein